MMGIEKLIIPSSTKVFLANGDRLEKMYRTQLAFHRRLHKSYHPEAELAKTARNIMMEGAELMDQLNWKEWKTTRKEVDWEQVNYELADIMAFLLNACIEAGINYEDLFQYYMRKAEVNVNRQEANY